jgi:hypothetical protein
VATYQHRIGAEMKQLLLEYNPIPNPSPTIGSLQVGDCFMRPEKDHGCSYLYMLVNILGIRFEMKDTDGRNHVICNLKTGSIFPANGAEVIKPLPHAAVIEDSTKQLQTVDFMKGKKR